MSTTFPHAKRNVLGYDVSEVEAFLDEARQAYDADPAGPLALSSSRIRQASFAMRKGGYSCRHVDAAMERLELAFARRERDHAIAATGSDSWLENGHARIDVLTARFGRSAKHRFTRVGFLSRGYSVKDVDKFVDAARQALPEAISLSAEDVRNAVFRSQFRGYDETQVDLVLDGLVDVLLAVRTD